MRKHTLLLAVVFGLLSFIALGACASRAADTPIRASTGDSGQDGDSTTSTIAVTDKTQSDSEVSAETTLGFNIRGWT